MLHELVQALDGREVEYLTRFFGDEELLIQVVTGESLRELRRGRPSDRAVVRGIVLDTVVEAFGGPEAAVALADRLRELGSLRGLQVFSQGQPEGPSNAARTVLSLPTMQEWGAWTLSDVVDYVAGKAVPAEAPDEEVVRYLGPARAAELTSVPESRAQAWLDGSGQPFPFHLRRMREAALLPSSELVRYLGPGRALEVAGGVVSEGMVWQWLVGAYEPRAEVAGRLRRVVLGAITEGLLRPQPLRRVVWSANGIREAERRLAWADATKGDQFPSGARSRWEKVDNPDPPLRNESRAVINGLEKSLKASVRYLVVQVLLGNADARAMVRGSGIVIPDPGPWAVTGLLEQIADHLRAARGMLDSGVLRRVVGGAASTRFQEATGGVVPQLRLTSGPDTVREFMQQTAADDVHFLVLKVPSGALQDGVRAEYVKGEDAEAFLASGGFFGGGQAHYFLDAVQGDVRRIDPDSTLSLGVMAAAGDALAWWARHGGLRASAQGSGGGGSAAPVWRGEGSQSRAADIAKILGGPEQVAWLDGRLPRVLHLPESVRLERLGSLAGIAEVAELTGRIEQHLEAMPPGFDPDRKYARNVERAKRMVRQGAWTAEDLKWVKDKLPGMRAVEEKWRGLARSLRRGAADRELRGLSDQADAGLAELSGPARDSLLDAASEKLGAPLNGSPRVVSVMAHHMMGGAGDGEIARVRDRLARIWVDLTAASAGGGPGPGTNPGAGPESVGDTGAVAALPGEARSESTEDVAGATEDEGFDPGSWLTEVALLPGDGARSSLGRDGGEVLPGRVDGAGAPVWDAEPSPGTPAGDAQVDAVIGKAESDEFDTFMEKEQPGLLDRLERVGGKEVPSESSTRSTGSVVDGDAVSTGETGARRRQAWPGVGTDQDNSTDGGARSIGDSSSSDSGSGRPGRWSRSDLDREIARAKRLDLSSGEREAAGLVVRRAHDVRGLARADAVVPLEDVVALVAAKRREVGDAHQDQVVEFSQALADRLGTQGSGLTIHAGAGPQPGRDMLRQSADDPGPAPGEPRTRYVVHGDPGRKTDDTARSDDTAQAGPGFSPVAHDLRQHVDGPAWEEVWMWRGGDGVKPVPDTIQGRRPERDGARRRLSWPGSRRAGDTAPTTASGSSHATSRASREAREIPNGPVPIRPQENTGQVTGRDGFAGFLGEYSDDHGVGSVGLSGEGTFGDPSPEAAVWPGAGRVVGFGDRFVRGVNQAGYLSGDARFRVNCLEAVVALHNSVKFGRQFVAGPAGGDRDPARLEVAFGVTARRVAGVAGAERYVRSGPVGVAVPVIYQRADGSAHVIAAVHAGERDEQGRVVLLDAQKGRKPRQLMSRLRPGCG